MGRDSCNGYKLPSFVAAILFRLEPLCGERRQVDAIHDAATVEVRLQRVLVSYAALLRAERREVVELDDGAGVKVGHEDASIGIRQALRIQRPKRPVVDPDLIEPSRVVRLSGINAVANANPGLPVKVGGALGPAGFQLPVDV